MAYKEKIYDMTALEMYKRMEVFLDSYLGRKTKSRRRRLKNRDVKDKIDKLNKPGCEEIVRQMHGIRRIRNDIVHPKNLAPLAEFYPLPAPVLDSETRFSEFQEKCFWLDDEIYREFNANLRMKEIMLPTLKYSMGNAGDIIKHGLLAEFIEWYKNKQLRFADPFGGCPWGNLPPPTRDRLKKIKETALGRVYSEDADKYLGSSHLAREAAKNCNLEIKIGLSDNDKDARRNLENSIREYDCMEFIAPRLPKDDGYQILYGDRDKNYDLILLDPYSKFLWNEFYRTDEPKIFRRILELIKNNPGLFVAVFVLDKNETTEVGEKFHNFKKTNLQNRAFSLHCPKFESDIKGESKFDSEILLISGQINEGKCGELRGRLENFAGEATGALPLPEGEKVMFWGGD